MHLKTNWFNLGALAIFLFNVMNPHLYAIPVAEASTVSVLRQDPHSRLFHTAGLQPHIVHGVITAYSSTPDQTDGNPEITASGARVHDGIIAANGLPFGTIVKIPSLFGNKRFIVADRMNARYRYGHFDVWLSSRREAVKFGLQRVTIEIYLPTDTELAVK